MAGSIYRNAILLSLRWRSINQAIRVSGQGRVAIYRGRKEVPPLTSDPDRSLPQCENGRELYRIYVRLSPWCARQSFLCYVVAAQKDRNLDAGCNGRFVPDSFDAATQELTRVQRSHCMNTLSPLTKKPARYGEESGR